MLHEPSVRSLQLCQTLRAGPRRRVVRQSPETERGAPVAAAHDTPAHAAHSPFAIKPRGRVAELATVGVGCGRERADVSRRRASHRQEVYGAAISASKSPSSNTDQRRRAGSVYVLPTLVAGRWFGLVSRHRHRWRRQPGGLSRLSNSSIDQRPGCSQWHSAVMRARIYCWCCRCCQ